LFDSSLRANLRLARSRDDAPSEAELIAALEQVGLGPLLADLPEGLETRIGSWGSHLSGGQRQRVAIARTLLTRADVLLIDEPAAHLDRESADTLMADLRAGLQDKVVVLVTHHLDDRTASDVHLELGVHGPKAEAIG
jgi:ATP-binding cassette subfamily C protein CydCD